jgi:hypothetical protein
LTQAEPYALFALFSERYSEGEEKLTLPEKGRVFCVRALFASSNTGPWIA